MIFVYPAIVSNNVDKKIAPVVCKVIEQFFLSHLAEAFQSGTLRVKTEFDSARDVYGPLKLENKKIVGKTFLTEAKYLTEVKTLIYLNHIANDLIDEYTKIKDKVNKSGIQDPDFTSDIDSDVTARAAWDKINDIATEVTSFIMKLNETIKDINDYLSAIGSNAQLEKKNGLLENARDALEQDSKLLSGILKTINSKHFAGDKSKDKRSEIEKRKFEHEKGKEKLQQYETHGSYKVEMMKGVSLKPSMMNINVKIHYVDGPHKEHGGVTPSGSMQEIAVGCKVLPMILESFGSIEDAILNDYFATNQQMAWRTFYRNFLRSSDSFVQKVTKFLFGKRIGILKNSDPVNAEILLAPQGYINASSFKHKGGSAEFYNYSSAIVMFNKDDIMKEEGANFFLDKSQLAKMFKAGWNSFCILDPHREEAMFISALDGGYLHIIPYAYIFNTLQMDQIYTNMNDLQRRSPVFRKSVGSFSSLVSRLRRESALLRVVKQFITERENGESK